MYVYNYDYDYDYWTERSTIGPLQDPVTWYGINYTGTPMTQWDFQNKGILTSPDFPLF